MSGDPRDVFETAPLVVKLYCHVIVGAGLPVAMHVRLDVVPSAINVDGCIESTSFRITEPRSLKCYVENIQQYCIMISMKSIAKCTFLTCGFLL